MPEIELKKKVFISHFKTDLIMLEILIIFGSWNGLALIGAKPELKPVPTDTSFMKKFNHIVLDLDLMKCIWKYNFGWLAVYMWSVVNQLFIFSLCEQLSLVSRRPNSTQCLVETYGNKDVGQHWFR